jgi:hypothetical protein
MICPVCQTGTIRAHHSGSNKGRLVFCDNAKCFNFFAVKDAEERPDVVIVRHPLVMNRRMTAIMKFQPAVTDDQWTKFVSEHQLVEEAAT